MIEFDSSNPYWKAFLVGLTNTIRVAIIGILIATVLGTAIGIGRLSRNFLLRAVCTAYVEIFRNIPVLLQLLMWYLLLNELLPPAADALNPAPGMYLSKGGFAFPVPVWVPGYGLMLAGARASLWRGCTAAGRARSSRRPDTRAHILAVAGDHRC